MNNEKLPKGIRKHGKKYIADVRVGGERKTVACATVKEAVDARTILKAEMYANAGQSQRTLQDACDQTWQDTWSQRKWGHDLLKTVMHVIKYFGPHTPLQDIRHQDIQAFRAHSKTQGISNATINRRVSGLNMLMTTGYNYGWIKHIPKVKGLSEYKGRVRWLTYVEEDTLYKLFTQWSKPDHCDALTVLLDTGMRNGELWALEGRDVDFNTNLIHIWENKTDKPRSLPMTTRTKDVLLRRFGIHNPKLFPYDNWWFECVWGRARVSMGLENDHEFVPYACRHTCASRLIQKGMKLELLMLWMGHGNLRTTMRYAHLCPSNLLEGAKLLERSPLDEGQTSTLESPPVQPTPNNPASLGTGVLESPAVSPGARETHSQKHDEPVS